MTVSTLITMAIGLLVPLLTAVVTKEGISPHVKALIMLALTTISGVIAGLTNNQPTNLAGWKQVALNIVMTYLTAAVSLIGTWQPSGTIVAIHRATRWIGFGSEPRHAQHERGEAA